MRSQTCEGKLLKAQENDCKEIIISTFPTLTTTYRVKAQLTNGSVASFILDTGAAVKLLRKDVWDKVKPRGSVDELESWTRK